MRNILGISEFLAMNESLADYTPALKSLIHTEKFKDWFGDWSDRNSDHSLIVDDDGYPLIMYHGSNVKGIEKFDMHDGAIGHGAYFTSSFSEACDYVRDKFGVAGLDDGDERYMSEDDCFEYVGCYFLNVRDENRIFNSKYGYGEICAMVIDNSEIMKVDLK